MKISVRGGSWGKKLYQWARRGAVLFCLSTFSRLKLFRDISGIGYFGLSKIDRRVSRYLKQKGGFYIELGANDGIRQSNTLVLEKYQGWKGLLIEPHPETFVNLCNNRSKNNFFENAACVDFDFDNSSVELIFSGLMTIQRNLELEDPNYKGHSDRGVEHLKSGETYSFTAVAVTLNALLVKNQIPSTIDFLSLDVEGAELQVLKGIDHSHFRFRTILIETRNIDEVEPFLASVSYSLIESVSHHDYVFIDSFITG